MVLHERTLVGRLPQHRLDLGCVEKEDILGRGDRAVAGEPVAEGERGSADQRLRDPVDPVVVLFGQRSGSARRGHDLVESLALRGAVEKARASARDELVGARPQSGLAVGRGLAGLGARPRGDERDEARGIVAPRG